MAYIGRANIKKYRVSKTLSTPQYCTIMFCFDVMNILLLFKTFSPILRSIMSYVRTSLFKIFEGLPGNVFLHRLQLWRHCILHRARLHIFVSWSEHISLLELVCNPHRVLGHTWCTSPSHSWLCQPWCTWSQATPCMFLEAPARLCHCSPENKIASCQLMGSMNPEQFHFCGQCASLRHCKRELLYFFDEQTSAVRPIIWFWAFFSLLHIKRAKKHLKIMEKKNATPNCWFPPKCTFCSKNVENPYFDQHLWSVQHPKAGWNIQHFLEKVLLNYD